MAALPSSQALIRNLSVKFIRCNGKHRGFRTSCKLPAAQNFTMPAMSPTMTEGNIANWKVKEGDKYVTGDVLLEIETDKAQMDVEAQEDGQMAKIIQEAGAKGVKVGTRIAIIAEEDDDLSTLELPPDETQQASKEASSSSSSSSESKPAPSPTQKSKSESSKSPSSPSKASSSSSHPQTYPLYPSVAALLKEKGLQTSEVDKIPASGPKGRLLKGDVLSYIGSIGNSYSSEQSARIAKLGHLDLSNVQATPQKPADPPPETKTESSRPAPEPETPTQVEVTLPISLSAAINVQKRVRDSIGVELPLSTFIARATELANEDLPSVTRQKPSVEELFNDILGLDQVGDSRASRGSFVPQIQTLRPLKSLAASRRTADSPDIYDILTGRPSHSAVRKMVARDIPSDLSPSTSVFSVTAAKGEEKRARVFLERVKTILQVDAGRLIL